MGINVLVKFLSHLIERCGGSQVRQESVFEEAEEEVLVVHAVDTLEEEHDALLVGGDETRGHVAPAFVGGVGQCESQRQDALGRKGN